MCDQALRILLLPVLIDPARQRAILSPVFGALLDAIRLAGGTAQGLKAYRADAHAGTQCQGKPTDIGEFKCDVAIPAGIDGMGSDVDHQSEPGQAAASIEPADQIVGNGDPLYRNSQAQLTRVKIKGPPF